MARRFLQETESDEQAKTQTHAFIVAGIFCCLLSLFYWIACLSAPGYAGDIAADDRINPNTATVGSLVRLPGIGPKRAADVVEYRQSVGAGNIAFERPGDLEEIKGIGEKTVESIGPYLTFEP
jgi:competence ComEA-like helix-hairpin-helix protein